uniref:Uncharacterized protein n=1 Tax=Timema poppense TaxID=170557 RepID=A0A7R9GY26_TIMPO|nr:unnamed protein product [Timema poppensis]
MTLGTGRFLDSSVALAYQAKGPGSIAVQAGERLANIWPKHSSAFVNSVGSALSSVKPTEFPAWSESLDLHCTWSLLTTPHQEEGVKKTLHILMEQ